MTQVSRQIRDRIYDYVRRDLEPSPLRVHAKVASSLGLGGFLSLFLCGQMGLGLSSLAREVHHTLMEFAGHFGCIAICGVLFAVVPIFFLRVTSSYVHFQMLMRKRPLVISGWTLAFGLGVILTNQSPDGILVFVTWGVPAVLSTLALGMLLCQWNRLVKPLGEIKGI